MLPSRSALAAFLFAAVAAGSPAAPVPDAAKAPVLFFPTTPVTWVYEFNSNDEVVNEVVEVVLSVTDRKGDKLVELGLVRGGKAHPSGLVMAVSGQGLVEGHTEGGGFVGDAPVLKVPAVPAQQWVAGKVGRAGQFRRFTSHGAEEVEVPAGRFRAMRVETTFVEPEGMPQLVEQKWYAPGVGVVKQADNLNRSRVLKRFTRGRP